ncbi:MAG: hypothetical protein FWG64_05635 [Firmicutes bacterium]|nr:hypothetical protein [Bacillota bacterium]
MAKFDHQPQPDNRLLSRTYNEKMPITAGVTQVAENMISNTVSVLGFWAPASNEMIVDQHANNYTVTVAEINEDNVIVAYSQNVFPAVDIDYEIEVDLPAEQEGENE